MNLNFVREMAALTSLQHAEFFKGNIAKSYSLGLQVAIMRLKANKARAARAQETAAYIVKEDIPDRANAAWARIVANQNRRSFLAMVGLTPGNFVKLCMSANAHFPEQLRGRRRLLDYVDIVGLTLRWLTGVTDVTGLVLTFGASRSTIFRALDIGVSSLYDAMRADPLAAVKWPTKAQQKEYALQILNKGVRSPNGKWKKKSWPKNLRCLPFGWVDGSIFRIYKPYHHIKQFRYYSGKNKMHCVNCVIVFAPDGTIIWFSVNSPGSFHDVKVARELIEEFLQDPEKTLAGLGLFGDVGFRKRAIERNILTILKKNDAFWRSPNKSKAAKAVRAWEKRTEKWIFTHRMAVEWAFAGFKSTFRRLNAVLPKDETKRARLLELCVRMHNYRLRSSPSYCNQIRTVYEQNMRDDKRAY